LSRTVVVRGEDVRIETEQRIAWIVIDRPPVNAFRTRTWEELGSAVRTVAADRSISVVILRSAVPGIFSAGADVKELPMSPQRDEARQRLTRDVLDDVLDAPQPFIAAVDGPALGGGCALACAADIRTGSSTASFGLPEISVGRCGGSRHLMRHLPQGAVRLLYFTGGRMPAADAFRLGLLNLVSDDLDAITEDVARQIASKSPTALRMAKQALNLAERLDVRTGYEVEQQFSLRLAGTADAREAAAAFAEKREPVWETDPASGGSE
jgi:enoyl-CoA hydratase